MADSKQKTVKIKLVRSLIGRIASHKACAYGLGLRKIGQVVEVVMTPENMGMINRINYLLECEG
jgi:large subunit ribosomal protein L30